MMDDLTVTEFQDFLMGKYDEFKARKKHWRPSLNEFSRWLGVSSASLDAWLLGTRKPDLASALKLADKLGPEVFDVLGYDRVITVSDPRLKSLLDYWEALGDAERIEILHYIDRQVHKSGR